MDTIQKLQLLSEASQYDLACACGTNDTDRRKRGKNGSWLYPVSLPQGGYSVIFKTLMSNSCINDCKYCPYRIDSDVRRCTIGSDEVVGTFLEYYRQKKVFGLFLSSGVISNPDKTMELLNDTAGLLRKKHNFRGYIHLKIIPGASDAAIEEAVNLASAVSINIETPGIRSFGKLTAKKNYMNDIIAPLKLISRLTQKHSRYQRVKKTTQFIVGASDETDAEIVRYTAGMYKKLNLNRVYFSSYQRGLGDSNIPGEERKYIRKEDGFLREHRLYQVDFLLRKYGFIESDFVFDEQGHLFLDDDPKNVWAKRHPEFFPVNINHAGKYALLRVPGIGPQTARMILEIRKEGKIRKIDGLPLKGKRLEKAQSYIAF
ncbi:MAG: radical SAM protein [Fibrobacter sp.]|nr:radical SAM protein [Fibrobacter sp.]